MLVTARWRALSLAVGSICCLLYALTFVGCGVGGVPQSVAISALPSEDLLGPCTFELSMAHPDHVQQGILVFYERGDTDMLYNDATLREAIAAMDYSILWARQCNAESTGDLQADASKGSARMLFSALNQLASKASHPELTINGIILYGFSAAGVLTATMANIQPARLVGTIQYAAGSAYTDLDDVTVSSAAAQIPTLILANAMDSQSGTARSLHYFQRGRSLGAHWAYAVQRDAMHCCNLSTRNVVLPWIQEVARLNSNGMAAAAASPATVPNATLNSFLCTPDGVVDAQGDIDCEFTAANLGDPISSQEESGWLPSEESGEAWLAWVTNVRTNLRLSCGRGGRCN